MAEEAATRRKRISFSQLQLLCTNANKFCLQKGDVILSSTRRESIQLQSEHYLEHGTKEKKGEILGKVSCSVPTPSHVSIYMENEQSELL